MPEHFPFEIQSCSGSEALKTLEALQQRGAAEGFTPVLLGGDDDLGRLLGNLHYSDPTALLLERATTVNAEAWLQSRAAENDEPKGNLDFEPFGGAGASDLSGILVHLDSLNNRPKARVHLAKAPTLFSWEVPAYLRHGGWNECPAAEVQVAVSRHWYERYGAEVVAATFDVVQYHVRRPPTDRSAAEALAREHYAYCPDSIDQGLGNLSTLASALQSSSNWYFWWD